MIINDLDGYYIVFDTKNWNTELDTLIINELLLIHLLVYFGGKNNKSFWEMKKNMNQNELNLRKRLRNFCTKTETKIP